MIKSGSVADADKPGTASFTATLLNRGTTHRDAAAFARETDFLGSHVEAMASTDAISLTASSLNKYTEQLLDLMSDAARNPVSTGNSSLKSANKPFPRSKHRNKSPQKLASKLFGKLVFGAHPYGTFQTPESVQSITREDLTKFHATHFRPNNATLAIVGDVTLKDVLPLIEKAFGSCGTRRDPGFTETRFPGNQRPLGPSHRPSRLRPKQHHRLENRVLPGVPPICRKSSCSMPRWAEVPPDVSDGNLREKHGWTYGSYSFFDLPKDEAPFRQLLKRATMLRRLQSVKC